MMFSEGLVNQHLAIAQSADLFTWDHLGPVQIEKQNWLAHKYGAPFVWQEANQYYMVLMGEENNTKKTTLGLFHSTDGLHWLSAPEHK
jgi:sucrose-6-phosphate hydrolase SacC (GH32 family)